MITELNRIVSELSPSTVVQGTKKFQPWNTDQIQDLFKKTGESLNSAITKNNVVLWRKYKHKRNICNKNLEKTRRKLFHKKTIIQ